MKSSHKMKEIFYMLHLKLMLDHIEELLEQLELLRQIINISNLKIQYRLIRKKLKMNYLTDV